MDPAKTKVVQEWPVPKNVKEVQSFLGFANFYRHFIAQYSAIAKPLTNLTRKDVPIQMTTKCIVTFERLKEAFTTSPTLTHSNPSSEPL